MSDFLKSAFDYFGSSGKSKATNELIGNNVEVGNQSFKVINLIAEGGFAVVFEVQDLKSHKLYALKRLLSRDTDTSTEIMTEINYLKKLSGHHNIIQLLTAASIGQDNTSQIGNEFLIVTELCTGGQVIQLMQRRNKAFPTAVSLQMFSHVCQAIEHMHRQQPPIIHRDLKVENLLINNNAVIKLCDFGSATTKTQCPDHSWPGHKRSEVQEEIEKHTTPMYRAPEMIDLYQNFPINTACDIWALGCVLYYFYFNKHPFQDSAKLAILNANYSVPMTDIDCGLIFQMLVVDPRQRLGISEIINEIQIKASSLNIPLKQSIAFDKDSLVHLPPLTLLSDPSDAPSMLSKNTSKTIPPVRPKPPHLRELPDLPSTIDQSRARSKLPDIPPPNISIVKTPVSNTTPNVNDNKKVFELLKEGAGSFMKNIRDVSNKVMEQVSSSINKADLDLVYVTSRIIMMPIPAEAGIELLTKDKIDDVQTFLDFRHPNQYYIYNLGLKFVSNEKFKDRIMHIGFDPLKPPLLNNLVMLCLHQLQWLLSDPKNVIVVQCLDGRIASGINVAALLCFCKVVNSASDALEIVKSRRAECHFSPSQLRYVDYVVRMMKNLDNENIGPDIPHNLNVTITGIELQPVPYFNKAKTGLRPFIEIFCDYKLVYTSMTNYEDLPLFTHEHNSVHIAIPNVSVHGDLNILIYHIRSNIVAKGKTYSIKVCETQLYTGYLLPGCTEVNLEKSQLDQCDSEEEKYPNGFHMKIQLQVTNKDGISFNQIQTLSWNCSKFKNEMLTRKPRNYKMVPFNSKEEMDACMTASGIKIVRNDVKPKIVEISNKTKESQPNEDFFFTLDWAKEDRKNIEEISPVLNENDVQSSNDIHDDRSFQNQQNDLVGDLLGDFGAGDSTQVNNNAKTDVDGLADFFSGFSVTDKQQPKSSSNVDLLGSFSHTESKIDSNLLFFDSSSNDKSHSVMFDLFGHTSSSTSELTHMDDWVTNTVIPGSGINVQSGQSVVKPSNSASNLLNMKNSSQMTTSPSFHDDGVPRNNEANMKQTASSNPKVPEPVDNVQPKNKKDAFQDLLGDFKSTDPRNGTPKSIKDIRKETMSRTTDPETLKVLDWIDGKEKNIRALLCSLPSILWSDVRWSGVNMAELVTVAQVKKAYKNAIRCVHPDKWNHSEHENLAKLIMMELNEAMKEFEAEKNACQ